MDQLFIVPHTHYDAVVFKTRAEYLEMGLPIILQALQCLRDDPRYRFVLDQVCYIRPFLERYPEQEPLFRRLLAEGRLQITCGMDSMADVNIPSGESWVRQVRYGKGYCREKLGIDVRAGWALDTFGHHPQMPQLLRKAGFDSYFFARGVPQAETPSEFLWRGIDGSEVLALWLPYSYGFLFGSPQHPDEFAAFMRGRYQRLKPLAATSNLLGPSGVDLGPAEPHVTALAEHFNHTAVEPFKLVVATPDEYLAALHAALEAGTELQQVSGDFNPIFQGCYSSRIEVKQRNRELERLLTSIEKLDALSGWLGLPCDASAVERAWEPVLFSQFHDCICGVQVDKVFDDTLRGYDYSRRLAEELLDERLSALDALAHTLPADELAAAQEDRADAIALVVWNTLAWPRSDVAEVEVGLARTGVLSLGLYGPDGQPLPVQVIESEPHAGGGLKRARIVFVARDVPAMGYAVYWLVPNQGQELPTDIHVGSSEQSAFSTADCLDMPPDHGFLANDAVRAEFDLWSGALTRLTLADGDWEALRAPGNVIAREHDGGDFWQLNGALKAGMAVAGTQRQPPPKPGRAELSNEQVGDGSLRCGPVMAEFRVSHPFGNGLFASRARLYAGLPRLELHTEILNNDSWVRYRALFPTTIAQGTITHEIPFGAIERPAQELPAQNWVDYSDGQHGLALLNRGLPGNNVDEGVMMLSLLRATQLVAYGFSGGYEPGTGSTSGQELGKRLGFDYALVPHTGNWQQAQAYRAGLEFNNPLLVRKTYPHAGRLPTRWGLLAAAPENVVVSALLPGAEGELIVRVYEAEGRETQAELHLTPTVLTAHETDLLEQPLAALPLDGHTLHIQLGAFEIKTFRLRLAAWQDTMENTTG